MMRAPQTLSRTESTAPAPLRRRRPADWRLHVGRAPGPASPEVVPTTPSLVEAWQAFGSLMFVASMAGCWVAVATTTTGPLLAAGELLRRVARPADRPA